MERKVETASLSCVLSCETRFSSFASRTPAQLTLLHSQQIDDVGYRTLGFVVSYDRSCLQPLLGAFMRTFMTLRRLQCARKLGSAVSRKRNHVTHRGLYLMNRISGTRHSLHFRRSNRPTAIYAIPPARSESGQGSMERALNLQFEKTPINGENPR